jgi:2-polyprenyl-3-methyl-5-hydroxy-6-metoxy-1,4-benzoquinol methylase
MAWADVKAVHGTERVALGPSASYQWQHAPEHLAMVLARYRAAAALIGGAADVLEVGCGEGIGAGILARGRDRYVGIDTDGEAIALAGQNTPERCAFGAVDPGDFVADVAFESAVCLDVIEHVQSSNAATFLRDIAAHLWKYGVCVIGTPSASFDHLMSPASKAGHVNTYTHARLHALMSEHFRVVQSFGMQDTSLHLGHPDARHYLLMCGIGPR